MFISTRLRKSIQSEIERNSVKLEKAKAEVAALEATNASLRSSIDEADQKKD